MNVLVTGGCGYVGSRLTPFLLADGHFVTVVDTQWFGAGSPANNESLSIYREDCRDWTADDYREYDAIIHLASLSQNEMYTKDLVLTVNVNAYLPEWDKSQLFVYASSVAAYGTSDSLLTEDSPLRPTTEYGMSKKLCDEQVRERGGVVIRAASVCGHSPNMRFDTPVNRMTRDALTGHAIMVNGGKQTRSHVHLDDLCDLYRLVLKENVRGEAFNAVAMNMAISETAEEVSRFAGGDIVTCKATDDRSYKVSGEKARTLGWRPTRELSLAIIHMKAICDDGNTQYQDFSQARMRIL